MASRGDQKGGKGDPSPAPGRPQVPHLLTDVPVVKPEISLSDNRLLPVVVVGNSVILIPTTSSMAGVIATSCMLRILGDMCKRCVGVGLLWPRELLQPRM